MNGFENEYEFVKALNNKKVKELNPLLQDLIYDIFYNIDKDDLIKAWRNHYKQKGDILIKINNRIRTISIKMGSRNSVHIEPIDSFIKFLRLCDIDEEIITEYLKYHYADSTINGTGNKRLSAEEYKKLHQKEIDKINNALNTENTLISALNRFVILGRNSYYPISAIVHVTPTDFFYLKIEDIKEINIKHLNEYKTGTHIGNLFIQPQNRCINRNSKYEDARQIVQIKWYSLFDDIIENMNDKVIKKIKYKKG